MAIVLIVEIFWTVQNCSTINTIKLLPIVIIASDPITNRDRSHLIVLLNRGDLDQPWTKPTRRSVRMRCDLPRSVTLCRVPLLTT